MFTVLILIGCRADRPMNADVQYSPWPLVHPFVIRYLYL